MKLYLVFISSCFLLASCANSSVYRKLNVDSGDGALIDIKQRAIFASKHKASKTINNKTITLEKTIICAEPSPDSLSAYAAELAAEANVPEKASAQLTAAFQESASFVGLRTQSIQLLRDSLYRLCEGYMSGALDKSEYDILMRRYQKYMVALLAIEQLTGTVRAPSVTINTKGSASAARSLTALRDQIKAIDSDIETLQNKQKEKEAEKSADGITDEKKKEIDQQISKYKTEIGELQADKSSVTKAIENARGLAVSGEATSTVSTVGVPTNRSEQHIQSVSKSVEKIVLNIINTDDTGQLCWSYMRDVGDPNTELGKSCRGYIDNINKRNKLRQMQKSFL